MAADIGSIGTHLKLEMGEFTNNLNVAQQQVASTADSFKGIESAGKAIQGVGTTMTIVGGSIVASIGKIVDVSKEWDATVAQQQFIYQNLGKSVQGFISDGAKQAESLGITEQQYKNNATALANSLNLLGSSDEVIAKNGEKWMNLAADMGAFADVPIDTVIGDMKSALVGNFEAVDKYGMNLSVATINNGEYAKSINKTWEKMTQAEKTQAIMNETMRQGANFSGLAAQEASQFGMTWNNAKQKLMEAVAALGQQLLPVLAPIVAKLGDAVEAVGNWANEHPKLTQAILVTISALGALLVIVGPILVVVGGLMSKIVAIREGMAMLKALKMASIFSKIPGPINLIKMAFSGVASLIRTLIIPVFQALWGVLMANPIILIIMAIAALVAGFIYLWNNCEGFREFWINLWETIKTACINAWNSVVTFFTVSMPEWFNSVIQWFQQLPGQIWYWFLFAINYSILWVEQMGQNAWKAGCDFVNNVIQWFQTLPERIWNWLVNAYNNAVKWKDDMIRKAQEAGKQFVDNVINWFKTLPERIWRWFLKTLNNVLKWKRDMEKKAEEAAKEFVDGVIEGIQNLPGDMLEMGKSICKGLADGIWGGIKWVTDAAKGIAKQAEKDARAALKINSPSKVFRDRIGKSIPEGMAIGIDANADSVYKTLRNLSNNLATNINVSGLMDSINIRTSDINVNSKNSNAGLITEIKGLIEAVKSNSTIDYDKMARGFEEAVNKIDNTIVMDKTIVGKMTAEPVRQTNDAVRKRLNRLEGVLE